MKSIPAAWDSLTDAYERSRLHAGGGSEFLADPQVVNARLQDAVDSARVEILAAQPSGPRTREHLEGARGRDTGALDRGVALRTLYRATVRDNSVTAEYARTMASRPDGRSAEFRTLEEPFARAIVVDRRVAFISNTLVAGAHEHAAWQITDGAFVRYIVDEFLERWRRAQPWHGETRVRSGSDVVGDRSGVRTTARQREILRDLAAELPQQKTATRLDISIRTLSGEVSVLKDLFDVSSLHGLLYKWALSPDRNVDDSAPVGGAGAVTSTGAVEAA
ncbi:hypothetical protein [Streptomyces longwoodensis]|uniref:hypothetical protein n=1 Tax=Streptomyces longwoodensis TaxID=68231 RepID=UPI0022531B8E|nr:hypothetical protein [Streptomyces longwoodensis]MCX5000909.1 hypothetical protein [Streptomyces longwoodensis]